MELLLRLYEENEVKCEISLFRLENLDIMQNVYPKEILIFERLEINYVERSVSINKEQVIFTSKEFEILFFLASYPGQVFTHRQIYETVWGKEYFCDEGNVTAHIGRIRKKIEPDPRNPTFIQTVRGVGYKFVKK
jgi:two-component system alkaline phosphatase synthesis response regulator PhoP